MEEIYRWVRNIASYLVFLAVLEQLLPEKKYVKYIQLFAGAVLVLLVIRPFSGSSGLSPQLLSMFRQLELRSEAEDLEKDILGVEKKQLSRLMAEYESLICDDIGQMAENAGFGVISCTVELCKEEGEKSLGEVRKVHLKLSEGQAGVKKPAGATAAAEPAAAEGAAAESSAAQAAAAWLREEIVACYHLEGKYVEIELSERKR